MMFQRRECDLSEDLLSDLPLFRNEQKDFKFSRCIERYSGFFIFLDSIVINILTIMMFMFTIHTTPVLSHVKIAVMYFYVSLLNDCNKRLTVWYGYAHLFP